MRGRILWVDDEIDLLKPHILYLEEKGYHVEKASNGSDGVSAVEKEHFDLVLLDEMMPGMDGIATLRQIKDERPAVPVIMITKSEEEWLMDEAISEKIADYLTKPVNPSQIFLACKKILEEERILEGKATETYLKDFQEIEARLSTYLSMDDWWDLHVKLVQWQLEMDKRKDLGFDAILDEQLKSANNKFTEFVVDQYLDWIHSEPENRPTLSVDVFQEHVVPPIRDGQKIFLLVIDCFRMDQAMTILPGIHRYFRVNIDYHLCVLPSATPFCRNAIFSGLFLSDIQKNEPDMWSSMMKDEYSLNRFEPELLKKQLRRSGCGNVSFSYDKVNVAKEGRAFHSHLKEYMDRSLIALVVNFVDLLAHHRSESDVLQEMMPDEAGYRSTVRTWFENSWLFDVLKTISDSDHTIILTSDHGSIRVQKGVQVVADRETSTGVRYKYGRNLNCPDKHALVVKHPHDYLLPDMTTGTNYLIAKKDVYFVYPTQYHRYLSLLQNSFQHGGISMEEMLVPVITLTGQKE